MTQASSPAPHRSPIQQLRRRTRGWRSSGQRVRAPQQDPGPPQPRPVGRLAADLPMVSSECRPVRAGFRFNPAGPTAAPKYCPPWDHHPPIRGWRDGGRCPVFRGARTRAPASPPETLERHISRKFLPGRRTGRPGCDRGPVLGLPSSRSFNRAMHFKHRVPGGHNPGTEPVFRVAVFPPRISACRWCRLLAARRGGRKSAQKSTGLYNRQLAQASENLQAPHL